MHNNYYFLRQLSLVLEKSIQGFTVVSCFSQNKDELIIEFNDSEKSFFIKATLLPEFQCLSFPASFHRAKKNSIDLFSEVLMQKVQGVRQFRNERSIALLLGETHALVFKMHGRQSNVLLFDGQKVKTIFKHNFTTDSQIRLDNLDRTIDWSEEAFEQHQHDLETTYFTLGKAVWDYLKDKNFAGEKPQQRWQLFLRTLKHLEASRFTITEKDLSVKLTLLPVQESSPFLSNPIEVLNEFFHRCVTRSAFHKEKISLLSIVRGKMKQTRIFLEKTVRRQDEIEADRHYQLWGDLIMANIHTLKPGTEIIELTDFQDDARTVTVKLKKELSPQKNAELFYQKAKNRNIELHTLKETALRKANELNELLQKEKEILDAVHRESLHPIASAFASQAKQKDTQQTRPYHEHEWKGFRIWVGKNAKANDVLTLRYAYKEDLWLHAKDISGSHVIIKYQAGKAFPKDVIERAAGLAAYHSKRKNEAWCPVAVTAAKFVRKRKGDPPGAMVVEREEVILVEPEK